MGQSTRIHVTLPSRCACSFWPLSIFIKPYEAWQPPCSSSSLLCKAALGDRLGFSVTCVSSSGLLQFFLCGALETKLQPSHCAPLRRCIPLPGYARLSGASSALPIAPPHLLCSPPPPSNTAPLLILTPALKYGVCLPIPMPNSGALMSKTRL